MRDRSPERPGSVGREDSCHILERRPGEAVAATAARMPKIIQLLANGLEREEKDHVPDKAAEDNLAGVAAGHNQQVAAHTEVVRRTGPGQEVVDHTAHSEEAAVRRERLGRVVEDRIDAAVVVPAVRTGEAGTGRLAEHLLVAHSGRNRAAGTVAVPELAQVEGTGMELLERIRRRVGRPREGVRRTPEELADRSRVVGNS